MQLADVLKSLRLHWRTSVAIFLLAGLGLAIFLVTRNQVQPAKRYRVDVQVLIPAVDSKGVRPAGVPPALLQGQALQALAPSTEKLALDGAAIPAAKRHSVEFAFAINDTNDIITLSVSAGDPVTARAVARRYGVAYIATRKQTVAKGATDGLTSAKASLAKLATTLATTEKLLNAAAPGVLPTIKTTTASKNGSAADSLPAGTSKEVDLLVVQYEALLNQIRAQERAYAANTITALIPQGYASIVEINPVVQTTPPLPSPLVPIAIFLGVGLALALAVPVLMDRLDHSIRTPKSAGDAFDATVLASIPPTARRLRRSLTVPGTAPDAAYRALAATAIATDRLPQAIVVMAPTGTVHDTVAANFAAALAGLGLRVALVATEARQSWFLDARRQDDDVASGNGDGYAAEPGTVVEGGGADAVLSFPDLLELAHEGRLNGTLARGLVKTRLSNLLIMPPGDEAREFSLDGLRPLLEAMSSGGVDVTVIAGPAFLEDPNATILAWTTRCVLWACEAGEVTESEAREAAERLALAGAASFGVAMVSGKS